MSPLPSSSSLSSSSSSSSPSSSSSIIINHQSSSIIIIIINYQSSSLTWHSGLLCGSWARGIWRCRTGNRVAVGNVTVRDIWAPLPSPQQWGNVVQGHLLDE
jgi:hypothetical protein